MRFPRVTPGILRHTGSLFPELDEFKNNPESLRRSPTAKHLLKTIRPVLKNATPIPVPTYTRYRDFLSNGDRDRFQDIFFEQRRNTSYLAVAQLLDPNPAYQEMLNDYIWSICENTTWILPAHENGGIDLTATDTAFLLSDIAYALKDDLPDEIHDRIAFEVDRRVLAPFHHWTGESFHNNSWRPREPWLVRYLKDPHLQNMWWKYHTNNWNGVCNGAVGASMLYWEHDPKRLADGLNEVIKGLTYYFDMAFDEDGTSTEGIGYWQYGLTNVVIFSELLRNATHSKIDLFTHPKAPDIARYPLNIALSKNHYFNYSDSHSNFTVSPIMGRMSDRAGVPELHALIASRPSFSWHFPSLLRTLLWRSHAAKPGRFQPTTRLLPASGIFRLVSGKTVIAGKAGHNSENHNHNDVGSFVAHYRGETYLADLGSAIYNRDYFSNKRYTDFIQASSHGHNVPVVDGTPQSAGESFRGDITRFDAGAKEKTVEIEFSQAYPVKSLKRLSRVLTLKPHDTFILIDTFTFKRTPRPASETFVSRFPVTVRKNKVTIRGEKGVLTLTVAEPDGAVFHVEKAPLNPNTARPGTVNKVTVELLPGKEIRFSLTGVFKKN